MVIEPKTEPIQFKILGMISTLFLVRLSKFKIDSLREILKPNRYWFNSVYKRFNLSFSEFVLSRDRFLPCSKTSGTKRDIRPAIIDERSNNANMLDNVVLNFNLLFKTLTTGLNTRDNTLAIRI